MANPLVTHIELRPGVVVTLQYPPDLRPGDAEKVARVLAALATKKDYAHGRSALRSPRAPLNR